jgi:hypothetical protein
LSDEENNGAAIELNSQEIGLNKDQSAEDVGELQFENNLKDSKIGHGHSH